MKNNYIFGLNFLHSDSSSCLFKNNELIVAIEEERFSRVKHSMDFLYKSIEHCLNYENINISDVKEAINCFNITEMDILVLENYILTR